MRNTSVILCFALFALAVAQPGYRYTQPASGPLPLPAPAPLPALIHKQPIAQTIVQQTTTSGVVSVEASKPLGQFNVAPQLVTLPGPVVQQQNFVAPQQQTFVSTQQQNYVAPQQQNFVSTQQQTFVPALQQSFVPAQQQSSFVPAQQQSFVPAQQQSFVSAQQQSFAPAQQLNYVAPQQQSYVAPQQQTFVAPQQQTFVAPQQQTFVAPQQQTFVAPQPLTTTFNQPQQLQYHPVQPVQRQTIISKEIYLHSAPEEQEEDIKIDQEFENSPIRKNYRVVFIKAPSQNFKVNAAAIKKAQAANEEKTVIYVLSKKPDIAEVHNQLQLVQSEQKTHKPEVYFIKYKTQEEAQRAQQEIQAQYDGLGGSTQILDEGVAPIRSVIGSAGKGVNLNTGFSGSSNTGASFTQGGQQSFGNTGISGSSTSGSFTQGNQQSFGNTGISGSSSTGGSFTQGNQQTFGNTGISGSSSSTGGSFVQGNQQSFGTTGISGSSSSTGTTFSQGSQQSFVQQNYEQSANSISFPVAPVTKYLPANKK